MDVCIGRDSIIQEIQETLSTRGYFVTPEGGSDIIRDVASALDSNLPLANGIKSRDKEISMLQKWINDLQSGMYINCVYCGHRYGASEDVPASMADILKEHIENCPRHPMSALKANNKELEEDNSLLQNQLDLNIRENVDEVNRCGRYYEKKLKNAIEVIRNLHTGLSVSDKFCNLCSEPCDYKTTTFPSSQGDCTGAIKNFLEAMENG